MTNILKQPIAPLTARGWEPAEDMHEFLYAKWVMKAHAHGIRFDIHLPGVENFPLKHVHALLADFIAADAEGESLEGLDEPELLNTGDKWKAFSSLQKGIRRNNPHVTWRACHALLVGGGGSGMWRRLAVTVQEDIGLADPYLGAMVALIASDKKLRDKVGEKKLLWWVVQHMCEAPKSRDLCDVVVYWFHCDRDYINQMFAAANKMSRNELVGVAANDHASFGDRMTAHSKAWGGKFDHVSDHGNPKTDAFGNHEELYDVIGLPPLFRFYCIQNYRATGEALHIPVPFVYQMMMGYQHAWTDEDPFESGEERMIGKMYSATFDKHVWSGKSAIRSFIKQCHPLRNWCKDHGLTDEQTTASIERAIFYTEGAILRPRMYFGDQDQISDDSPALQLYKDILHKKLISTGITDFEDGVAFFQMVQDKLGLLHTIRGGK